MDKTEKPELDKNEMVKQKDNEKDSEKQTGPLTPPPSVDGSQCDLNASVSSLDSKSSEQQTSFTWQLTQLIQYEIPTHYVPQVAQSLQFVQSEEVVTSAR